MSFPFTETVTIIATPEVDIAGVVVVYGTPEVPQSGDRSSQPLQIIDPAHTALVAGDVLRVRGHLVRVTGLQDHTNPFTGWRPAGIIHAVQVNPVLPDTATITRTTGETFDRATNLLTPTESAVWSGRCAVEVSLQWQHQATADQETATVPVTVSVPLDVLDVRVGDVVRVTASRDGRLIGRDLTVIAVMTGTTDPVRRLAATDRIS